MYFNEQKWLKVVCGFLSKWKLHALEGQRRGNEQLLTTDAR
jgi:hypothetical protein